MAKKIASKPKNARRTKRAFVEDFDDKDLNPREEWFVYFYLNHFNAAKAARLAGYSPKSAKQNGSDLLRRGRVRRRIKELMDEVGLTPERVKEELGKIVFGSDLADFGPWLRGEMTLEELRAEGVDTSLIESAREDAKGQKSVKLLSRLSALEQIVKILGMAESISRIKGGEDIGANADKTLQIVFESADPEQGKGENG